MRRTGIALALAVFLLVASCTSRKGPSTIAEPSAPREIAKLFIAGVLILAVAVLIAWDETIPEPAWAQLPTPAEKVQPPKDVDGLGPAKWGMTEDQVLAAYGKRARRIKNQVPLTIGVPKIEVKDEEIAAYTLARLCLDQSGGFSGVEFYANVNSERFFDEAEKRLTAIYGTPTSHDIQSSRGAYSGASNFSRRSIWRFPSVDVELRYVRLPLVRLEGVFITLSTHRSE